MALSPQRRPVKMKIKEASPVTSRNKKKQVDGDEVLKSIEKVFRESVKPTWSLWDKDIKVGTRGTRSAEQKGEPSE